MCVNLYTIYRYNMQQKRRNKLKRNKRQRKGIGSSVLFEMVEVFFVCLHVCVCVCDYDCCQCVSVCASGEGSDQISTIEVHENINNNNKD